MKIAENCVVSMHYRLTDEEGELIDSSIGGDPLNYLHGVQDLIPGLEHALAGRAAGDTFTVIVQPEQGYGPVDPKKIQTVPRSLFDGVEDLQPGMQLEGHGPDGELLPIAVTEVGEDWVGIDGNHPLAGMVLQFEVTVTGVRVASAEEIAHGHVH